MYDSNPDCGWVKDSQGQNIVNSQGFCCSCKLLDIIGIEDSFKRATSCDQFQFSGGSATAHCLRFDDVYYHAYEPQSPVRDYVIQVGLRLKSSETQEITEEYLEISPESTIARSDTMQTIAKIVGDFGESEALPDLSNKILLKVS